MGAGEMDGMGFGNNASLIDRIQAAFLTHFISIIELFKIQEIRNGIWCQHYIAFVYTVNWYNLKHDNNKPIFNTFFTTKLV